MCNIHTSTATAENARRPALRVATHTPQTHAAWAALIASSHSPISPGPVYRSDWQRRAATFANLAAATWRPVERAPAADAAAAARHARPAASGGVRSPRIHPVHRGTPVVAPPVPTPELPTGSESPREVAARWLADFERERERDLALRAQLSARPAGVAR